MKKSQKILLALLRVLMGWFFVYAGITKILDPAWSAQGYLQGASTFSGLYEYLLSPQILPIVNFLNEWGLLLIGVSLVLGAFVRYSAPLGALLMLLYYFPILEFPYVGSYAYIVDEHVIYAAVLVFLGMVGAGKYWGIDKLRKKK